ncbi:MAG: PAS domain S-box protein [Verrucomicrobiota bacterium]
MRRAHANAGWERRLKALEAENQALRAQKEESEETLEAMRRGEVDALVVNTPQGERLFTLAGAERPYRALIEQMQQGAATLSQDGTIHYANRAFANMVNHPLETLIGTRMEPYIQEPDRPAFAAMLGECSSGSAQGEVGLCAEPGGVFPALLSMSRLGQTVAEGIFMMIVTNLSERKQTEQVLASAKFAWAILEQAEGAIMVFDTGRRLVFANSAARRLAGLNPARSDLNFGEEEWGQQCYPDNRPMPAEEHALERALRGQRTVALECRMVRADGSNYNLLISGAPLQDEQGRVIGAVRMFTDITERKQMEERLAAAKQSAESHARLLEAANKEMETFSYSVSHDLRAPLRSIDAFSRILLEEYLPQLPVKAQEYLRFVGDGTRQMGRLIDDLLAFSRLGHQSMHVQPLTMDQIVRQLVNELAPEQEGRKLQVQIGDLPPCEADPVLLRVVWQNLLSNALKFSRGRDPAVIEIGSRRDGGEVVYFIKDNGVGFDMRYADKLFVVFQRLHRAEDFEGTGIGLAMVQRIIHRHGGRIWGEAQVDRGATFSFTLGEGIS